MIINHLKIALRNILKQKSYNILNVIGLAVGIASGLIIALHIQEELSYEKSITNYENIYRIHREGWAKSTPRLANEIKDFFPEIENIGRFYSYGTRVVTTENNNPGEVTGFYADSTSLKVFNYNVIEGDRHSLAAANRIVITKRTAERYFKDKSAIGKILKFDNREEYPVTAVVDNPPINSHIQFDFLISMPTFYERTPPDWANSKGWMAMYTYATLKHGTIGNVNERMPDFIRQYYKGDPEVDKKVESKAWQWMALKDIHLHSNLENEMSVNSSIIYVYVFIAVEILILIIASANFMSLFTTQAIKRAKEVGMRKIMGAKPVQLMNQFLIEVLLLTSVSLLLAIILYQLALPFYNDLSGKTLGIWQIFSSDNMVIMGGILFGVILISGLYPAFFISGFKAGSFLKESKLPSSMPNRVRSGLVVFQFVVSVSLIASAIFVQQQMNLMKNKDLGFDKNQVVNIKLYGYLWWRAFSETDLFKNEFLKNPDILAVGRTGNLIGERLSMETVVPSGKDPDKDQIPVIRVMRVDEGYLDAMSINLVQGRNFSKKFNDSTSYIINESAAKLFGLSSPINEELDSYTRNHRKGKVVGVVKDFHFASLHDKIEPLIIEYEPEWTGQLVMKISAGKTKETLDYIKRTIDTLAPNSLFSYQFLDDRLDALYRSEDNMGKVFQFFSVLAIVIACLGLLGLSAYTIESKTKEIGIRKVLGSTVTGIVTLVSSKFFILILTGFVIAVPLTWYVINKWLTNFAYQIQIEWWVFALTGLIVVTIAAVAVAFHTIKAAMANPVKSLRYE